MKKFAAALLLASFGLSSPALASEAQISEGKMLYDTEGKRLGAIYRVQENGAVQVIRRGKMVTFPASTLSVKDGKIETSLGAKPQVVAKKED